MDFAEFRRKVQTHVHLMICHLNSFDLSKSFKVSPAEHLLLSTWRWACQAGRRGAEVHANFNCKLLVNKANSQSDNLCETLFEPHNPCPWKIIQNSLETPREEHLSGNMQTYTQSPTFGQVLKGSILKAVCFVGANSFSSHRVRIVRQLLRRNSEASRWFRVPMDDLGTRAFWSCRHLQVSALYIHTYPANLTQKSNNQAQR